MFPTYSLLAATSELATGASGEEAKTVLSRLGFTALRVSELGESDDFSDGVESVE